MRRIADESQPVGDEGLRDLHGERIDMARARDAEFAQMAAEAG